MHLSFRIFHIILTLIGSVLADFLGPSYPAPTDLSSNQSLVAAGWRNVTATLQTYLNDDKQKPSSKAMAGMKNITFSMGMFSLHDPAATEMQFHYTSPEVANAKNGTHKVDGDSIYRIASVTKLFTVFAGLLELKSTDWDRPLTDIFPTLAEFARKTPGELDPTYTVEWDKVTLNALASQLAGVPRDEFLAIGDILLWALAGQLFDSSRGPFDQTLLGLPVVNRTDPIAFPPCANYDAYINATCSAIPWVESFKMRAPTFLPWTSPAYTNSGFGLLGLAIANITGKSLDQVYRESIFNPLGMTSSSSSAPPESEWYRSVIPGEAAINFAFDAGVDVSSGGILSTTQDLAKLGIAILNSTLLPPDQTRKWLKPVSHTARLQYSVGKPWEILRYTHPSGAVTDIYTKLGDSGAYSGFIALVPDYDAGFSILAASSSKSRFEIVAAIAELITYSILPSLAGQAASETEHNFGGVYSSLAQGLNSSLILSLNQTEGASPGLAISSWFSNGTNVVSKMSSMLGPLPYRLLPSISDSRSGKVAFRLVNSRDAPSADTPVSLFSGPGIVSRDWIDVDDVRYGGIGLSLFVFDVAPNGKAMEASPAAFRIKLKRVT
jgi:CubicO group peptidase (beta-lactamase class C family)